MTKYQPVGGFEVLSSATIDKLFEYFTRTNGVDFKDDSSRGLLLVVDLSISDPDVARMLDLLPPCVYMTDIGDDLLSPYMQNLKEEFKITTKGDRLILDLTDKKEYSITAINLKSILRVGVKLTKIHSGISFFQKPVLRDYVLRLGELRRKFTADGLVSSAQACKKLANRLFNDIENVDTQKKKWCIFTLGMPLSNFMSFLFSPFFPLPLPLPLPLPAYMESS